MILEPCDIVFTRSTHIVSRLIRFATTSKGETDSWASHVGLISSPGYIGEAQHSVMRPLIIEALMQDGVVERPFSPSVEFSVARPINITQAQRDRILRKASSFIGDKYSKWAILVFLFGLESLFAKRWGGNWKICSPVVGRSFASAGLTFGKMAETLDPDDMMDFASTHPEAYRWIVPP